MPGYGEGAYGRGFYGVGRLRPVPAPTDPGHASFVPEVFLTIPGSVWPHGEGCPVGTSRVFDWSVEREIVAGSLPGQVRARSGFSIGEARVSVPQAAGRRPFAPWGRADRRVQGGDECLLYARDEATGRRWPLGAWQTKSPAGSLSSGQMGVELIESQYSGRKADARLPVVSQPVDAAWMVDQLARQGGFHSTPAPGPGTILSVPLCGGLAGVTSGGRVVEPAIGAAAGWSMVAGLPGLATTATAPVWAVGSSASVLLLTACVAGTVRFTLTVGEQRHRVDVEVSTGAIRARLNGTSWSPSRTFVPGLNPDWPTRVQVVLTMGGTSLSVRARSSANAPTSAPINLFPGEEALGVSSLAVPSISAGGAVAGIDLTDETGDPRHMWARPTARMSLLGGPVAAPWIPAASADDGDAWSALQAVCDAYMGAAICSLEGFLTVLNRHQLAGSGRPKTLMYVDTHVEDLAWTTDHEDYADRLEVTWHPVTWPEEDVPPEWPGVGDKLHVPAGRSVTVEVDLQSFVRRLAPWHSVDDPEFPATGVVSQWDANTAVDGSGASVIAGVAVSTEQTSPSSARVTVTNSTASDVWMVDFSGNPAMVLRGTGMASQESPQVIEYGAPKVDAKSELTIDLSKSVQDRQSAEALAGYLWGRVNRPRFRINSARMPLDWSRDLADILTLVHPDSDLAANVLVVRDEKVGQAGEIAQTCDFILLPPTGDEFDSAWVGKTGTAFDAVWAGRNGAAFDENPLLTEA